MKITIKEVAEVAGVSPSTVSRVISNSNRISEDTKVRVRNIMEELGYHPNAIARSLVSKSTKTIGVVMPQSTEIAILNPFFPQALSGVSAAAHKQDYCIVLSTGSTEDEQLKSIKDIVMSGRVDGVILMYSSTENKILDFLREIKMPILLIGKPLDNKGVLFVDNDNVAAAYKVTQGFINRGHTKIAYISGKFEFVVSLDRLDGYRNALWDNKLEFNRDYIVSVDYLKDEGYAAMNQLLQLKDRPTAVIVTDDAIAFGVIEALKDADVKIPEEIEIISFNNVPLSKFTNPKLSSVDVNAYQLGYKSGELLINNINNIEGVEKSFIVQTKIIYRESSKR
ncbi:LacI family DNA-binding transcriptional regulator [Clostridium grantii]|uniref:Transcriptional regulator, LacI family n=1 Tax=Clostridium grantii DSM 8605 TaxID=1121316 RepID=A0A1M5X999_9CLOT|nr:LacI family DNA-binding transcriptional regulator [Clostridium grantii]SHH96138.1 transcriptional regulator, LacI family [Clostridium grantii DSM 8605]